MCRQSLAGVIILLIAVGVGCGPGQLFEPTIYGIRQSVWCTMPPLAQTQAIAKYEAEERLRIEREKRQRVVRALAQQCFLENSDYPNYRCCSASNPDYQALNADERRTYTTKIGQLVRQAKKLQQRHHTAVRALANGCFQRHPKDADWQCCSWTNAEYNELDDAAKQVYKKQISVLTGR